MVHSDQPQEESLEADLQEQELFRIFYNEQSVSVLPSIFDAKISSPVSITYGSFSRLDLGIYRSFLASTVGH